MKAEDVKVGMKVVPFQKTACHPFSFSEWLNNSESKFFRDKGFCIVTSGPDSMGEYRLDHGMFFNASDFEPYIEPVKDNSIQNMLVLGNKTFIYLPGRRKGGSTCSPSDTFDPVKGVTLAYMRALGQTVDDIRIEINPAKTEDKPIEDTFVPHLDCGYGNIGECTKMVDAIKRPLFVGDTVDLYSGTEFVREHVIVAGHGKHFVMGIEAACNNDGTISLNYQIIKKRSYSDIPNGEVIDGVKYVKEP